MQDPSSKLNIKDVFSLPRNYSVSQQYLHEPICLYVCNISLTKDIFIKFGMGSPFWNCGIVIQFWSRIEQHRPLQWSEFLATDPQVQVRFPALPDFLRSSGSGTGSTQPHGYNWRAIWKKSSDSGLENRDYGRRDSSHWPRGTLYPQKLAPTSLTRGGRPAGIVCSRTQAMEFF
jgi:hypothetical protein